MSTLKSSLTYPLRKRKGC